MIDFHTHILPGIDDGSRDAEESFRLLRMEKAQGVDKVVLTPHFYAEKDRKDYFGRREKAYRLLKERIAGTELSGIRLRLAAEACYFPGIGHSELAKRLCIEGTDILLLEMPFAQWDESVVRDVDALLSGQKLTVIIAHIERYYPFQKNKKNWKELFEMPVISQINAGALLRGWARRRLALGWLRSRQKVVLGSDCHNTENRKPNLAEGRGAIEKRLGAAVLERIDALGETLFPI